MSITAHKNVLRKHHKFVQHLTRSSALTLCSIMAMGSSIAMAVDNNATPTGETVIGGSASFDRPSAGLLNVTQSSDRAVIDWDSFNIGSQAKTEFFQPSSNALAVNRVKSAGTDPTQILGELSGNGRIMVLDSNGVFVGQNAIVNASAVTFATGDIDVGAVMRGDTTLELSNFGDGHVINEGRITVADAGLVALVGKHVSNRGTIYAQYGRVALASGGEKVTLDLYGDGLVEIALGDEQGEAFVENTGTIFAEGGTVELTARAAKDVVDNVINMSGVIEATSFTQEGGKIILNGGDNGSVEVAGTLDVSGDTNGGTIEVQGQDIEITETATVFANAGDNGNGGAILYFGRDVAILNGSTQSRGGRLSGNGGHVSLLTDGAFAVTGSVDTTAKNGATGTFLIDPRDITLRLGTRSSLFDLNLYESDIEFLSNFTNITIEARRNFSIDSGIFGSGSDGVVTLADDSDLTIQTTNTPFSFFFTNEADNSGTIDLTGNATYGADLEFKTSGTGSISILGGTANDQVSDIILSKLTTDGGDINVSTLTGDINWNGDVNSAGGNITGYSYEDQYISAALQSDGGDIAFSNDANAFDDIVQINASGSVSSNGGDIDFDTNGSTGGFTVVYGDIDARGTSQNGDISFNSRQTQLKNSTLYADQVDFNGALVSQNTDGQIIASLLTGNLDSAASMTGQNDIDFVGDFATGLANWNDGGFSLHDIDGFRVSGDVTTTGGDIVLTTDSIRWDRVLNILSNGSLLSRGGDISINTNGPFGGAFRNWGLIDTRGTAGTGDIYLSTEQTNFQNGTVYADDIVFDAGYIKQSVGGTIVANTISGVSYGGLVLTGQNEIQTILDFETGLAPWRQGNNGPYDNHAKFTLNNLTDLTIDGVIKTDEANVTITNTGDLLMTALSEIDTQTQSFDVSANSITQDSQSVIIANTLTGQTQQDAVFAGQNQIQTLQDFATGLAPSNTGGFSLNNLKDLDVDGAVTTTGNDITITNDGDFNILTGATIDADGGDVAIAQTGVFTSADANTIKTSGIGTITLNQNDGGPLNDIFQSLDNTGSGLNTITVASGTYTDQALINDDNVLVIGANAGLGSEAPARGPESIVSAAGGTGITVADATDVVIDGFTFDGNTIGVSTNGVDEFSITNSIFANNETGFIAAGADNIALSVADNRFENNNIGAAFESGTLDLTAANLRFIDGEIGLRFAPDNSSAPLTLVDDTLGNSFFSGQSTYFVELDNGAFFAPGSPTVINAINATYDVGSSLITPADTLLAGGTLSSDTLNFLEERLYHNVDDDTLGLFFYGQPGLDEEDTTKIFGLFASTPGALSLTITGLPRVNANQLGATTSASLNAIAPASGGESSSQLAQIEPAAGIQNVSCWGDAISSASVGAYASFSFGNGADNLIASAANCSNGDI